MPLNWAAMAPPKLFQKHQVLGLWHSPGATLPLLNLGLDLLVILSQTIDKQRLW